MSFELVAVEGMKRRDIFALSSNSSLCSNERQNNEHAVPYTSNASSPPNLSSNQIFFGEKEKEKEKTKVKKNRKNSFDQIDFNTSYNQNNNNQNNNNNRNNNNIIRYQDKNDKHYDQVLDFTEKRFAYAFYITQEPYLCCASITAHRLRQWTDYDIVLIITESYSPNPTMMERLNDIPNLVIKIVPNIQAQHDDQDHYFWESLNKFHVFKLEEYDRIIFLDADTFVMKNLDHLFALPDVTLAAPMAYWLGTRPFLTNILMVLKPSVQTFDKIVNASMNHPGWDMDVINDLYVTSDEFLLLPSIYGMLNVEFSTSEKHYFGDDLANTFYNKTFLFHYTGFKPWLDTSECYDVSGHGDLYAKTWFIWVEEAYKYCI
ncbi:hypothetical protein DFA_05069 [Cavenderia fasciculata]|uniref:Uncharacterized protein n=1 Tax=Cavenderia fasciculata TaxID=261658 RepID=F4PN86_CACFS|nr:uncharacterized protein DFA_05069 [Cavenderia fasciculata]EGG22939.1 hypothetical protein DFA_05069 [Cavenderia fasciculata]|eukprot:XP_004360790.1 hypothetical protein DFA_05069 [Cavenderia fasciculata]